MHVGHILFCRDDIEGSRLVFGRKQFRDLAADAEQIVQRVFIFHTRKSPRGDSTARLLLMAVGFGEFGFEERQRSSLCLCVGTRFRCRGHFSFPDAGHDIDPRTKRIGIFEIPIELREVESRFRIFVVTADAGRFDKQLNLVRLGRLKPRQQRAYEHNTPSRR